MLADVTIGVSGIQIATVSKHKCRFLLTLLHSARPKLNRVLAVLRAVGLNLLLEGSHSSICVFIVRPKNLNNNFVRQRVVDLIVNYSLLTLICWYR